MKTILFLFFLLSFKCFSQNVTVRFDTLNFAYKSGPYLVNYSNLFNELPFENHLGFDQTYTTPIKKNVKSFEQQLKIYKPTFIQLVNANLLAIPNQKISGYFSGYGTEMKITDSLNFNYLFQLFNNELFVIRSKHNKTSSLKSFLNLFDSLRVTIDNKLRLWSSDEFRKRYVIDGSVLASVRNYYNSELGNFLFSRTYIANDFNFKPYKDNLHFIKLSNPDILLEYQQGRQFLQRHFFFYAFPKNNYDLFKTLDTDPFCKTNQIKKYIGYRYFSHLYSDRPVVEKITNFEQNFKKFKTMFSFTPDEETELKKVEKRIADSKHSIAALLNKETLINLKFVTVENKTKGAIFSGKKLLYFWASWCTPCRQYLSELKSSFVRYQGIPIEIIFISIDKDLNAWKKAHYELFNERNNFAFKDPGQSKLLKTFQIDNAVPRMLLIKDGYLIESAVDKNKISH